MFYDKYVELCKKINKSPSAVAIELGFNKGSVSVWKKKALAGEDVEPSANILNRIANYFNVTVDYLLGRDDFDSKVASKISDDDIKFALFGGDTEVTDEMYDEIKEFAEFVKNKYKNKKD